MSISEAIGATWEMPTGLAEDRLNDLIAPRRKDG